ncbi:hypothetical protein E4U30_003303 [Claviceps sp. LM220 group G6]|nr:hypothetical protein E4U30_003303 [Claviceps sp. LM220 group G6]KAG6101444.1 hypothetical protein E4U31_003667 [Claviceps sp. LM219 group G6]KAG6119614.1 hypothetical protein E4U14_005070 [Claviceps sp. LM454 group G7]
MPKKDQANPRVDLNVSERSLSSGRSNTKKSRRPLSTRACQSPHPRAPEPVEPAAPADAEPEEQVASIESDQYESAEDIRIGSAGRGIRKESL